MWKEDGNSRKQPTPLWAQPLSDDGTKLIGEPREILRNEASWEAHLIEGPFIQRRDGWFYLFYSADACCGRRCNYKLGVARSRALLGPWERHPKQSDSRRQRQLEMPRPRQRRRRLPGNRTFLLYHAYDPTDFEYTGRQGLLDEVTWGADGWPAINGGRGPSRLGGAARGRRTAGVDCRRRRRLRRRRARSCLAVAVGSGDAAQRRSGQGGWLRLGTGTTAATVVAARPTLTASYVATTVVDVASITAGARAGLAAFGNRDNVLAVTIEDRSGGALPDRLRPMS